MMPTNAVMNPDITTATMKFNSGNIVTSLYEA